MPAKRATVRLEKGPEDSLKTGPRPHDSEIDGSAPGATSGEPSDEQVLHTLVPSALVEDAKA